MDKAGKRLSRLGFFTFFLAPVFAWSSVIASDETAVFASLSRLIWYSGSALRIFAAMVVLFIPMLGLENLIEENALVEGAGTEVAGVIALTKVAALAYLMFNLYTPPCFAALGAMNSEIKDRGWFWSGIALQFATGFTVAYLVYQIGTLITTGSHGTGFVPGLIVVAAIAAVIVYLIRRTDRNLAKEDSLSGT